MSGNPSSTSGAPTGASQALDQGGLIPWFEKGKESPNSFSAKDMNRLVKYVRLLQRVSVERRTGAANPDGSYTPLGKFIWSDQKLVLELTDAPGTVSSGGGTVNVVLGRVTSESSEYVTVQPIQATGDGTYSDTAGSPFNVAKPIELRGLTGPQIDPQYLDTNFFRIFAIQAPSGGTGVYVSGTDVGYQDANVAARRKMSWTCYYLSNYENYWLCSTNSNGTGAHIRVAKPYQLQNQISGETTYGQTFSYAYINNTHGNALYGIYRQSTRASDSFVEYQGVTPQPQVGYPVKYVADGYSSLTVEAFDVMDNPTDTYLGVTITTGTPIVFRDDSNSGMAWTAFQNQLYGH